MNSFIILQFNKNSNTSYNFFQSTSCAYWQAGSACYFTLSVQIHLRLWSLRLWLAEVSGLASCEEPTPRSGTDDKEAFERWYDYFSPESWQGMRSEGVPAFV